MSVSLTAILTSEQIWQNPIKSSKLTSGATVSELCFMTTQYFLSLLTRFGRPYGQIAASKMGPTNIKLPGSQRFAMADNSAKHHF
jgi:hypothetical protein